MPGIIPPSPVAPWHMWGSSQVVSQTQLAPGATVTQTVQLAKISYRRPETWSFWLAARLVGGELNPGPANEDLAVNVHLITGVGRSVCRTEAPGQNGFVRFLFSIPPAVAPANALNGNKYTTRAFTVPLEDGIATSVHEIDHLVAQDIQCYADVDFLLVPVGNTVNVEVTAFFAPRVHVRPDWFSDAGETDEENEAIKFLGTERGGT